MAKALVPGRSSGAQGVGFTSSTWSACSRPAGRSTRASLSQMQCVHAARWGSAGSKQQQGLITHDQVSSDSNGRILTRLVGCSLCPQACAKVPERTVEAPQGNEMQVCSPPRVSMAGQTLTHQPSHLLRRCTARGRPRQAPPGPYQASRSTRWRLYSTRRETNVRAGMPTAPRRTQPQRRPSRTAGASKAQAHSQADFSRPQW